MPLGRIRGSFQVPVQRIFWEAHEIEKALKPAKGVLLQGKMMDFEYMESQRFHHPFQSLGGEQTEMAGRIQVKPFAGGDFRLEAFNIGRRNGYDPTFLHQRAQTF